MTGIAVCDGVEIHAMWPKLRGLDLLATIRARSFGTLPFIAFEVAEWTADREVVLVRLRQANLGSILVVRSCTGMEDAVHREPPGFFDSFLNVAATETAVHEAVEKVIASYARRVDPCPVHDKIIIQKQLLNATICGVFSVGSASAEYIEIDYDEMPGRTDAVTSGAASRRATISMRSTALPAPWRQISECAKELCDHFHPPFLVEFAIDAAGLPIIFQVRSDRRPTNQAVKYGAEISQSIAKAAVILDAYGPLSVMTDWNPAEILGLYPQPLDTSLYDELVMRSAWSEGRTSVGWARPADPNLMVVVGGRPYVKIRQSLQSLLPVGLASDVAERIVQDRLARLEAAKELHDKVEFRLMWSAYAFNVTAVREELIAGGISNIEVDQLFDALKCVTRYAIEGATALLATDRARIMYLEAARKTFSKMEQDVKPREMAEQIKYVFRICVDHGTIPFSRQARLAFTFRFIINHLLECGGIDRREVERWQSSLNTIARQFRRELGRMLKGEMAQTTFLERYGHLRPNTYDLESLRYDERSILAGDQIEDDNCYGHGSAPKPNARLSEILAEIGGKQEQAEFWNAAAGAYQGREEMKFQFTALLSDVLRDLAIRARSVSLERTALRRMPLNNLLDVMQHSTSWKDFRDRVLGFDGGGHCVSGGLNLPDVIFGQRDLEVILDPPLRPTFVGSSVVSGRPHVIENGPFAECGELAEAIVAVETADPGYDWLFGHRFGGLVTAYGGEFSHMGLRCGEFGITAALGCGPTAFRAVAAARELRVDPVKGELWADGKRIVPA